MNDKWLLYVVRCADDTLYTGVTTDLERRLQEHNTSSRGSKYTRTRRPVVVVYSEAHVDRSSAQKAEHQFKKMAKAMKEKVISESR